MDFDSIKVIGVKDGVETFITELYTTTGLPDSGEPTEPELIVGIITTAKLNVRDKPTAVNSTIVGQFSQGDNVFFEDKIYPPTTDNLEWLRVVKVNGANDPRVGGYVAKQYVDLNEQEPNPPKALSPSLYPVVEKDYEGVLSLNAVLDGNNDNRQTGANIRRALYMVQNNGAVRDPQFLETGADQNRLREELDRLNKPNWSAHEPIYGHFLRLILKKKGFSRQQILLNAHEFMRVIDSYRDQNGLPYIRVIICIVDTFNSYPNMVFDEYVQAGYHNGPLGKTNSQFWIDSAWDSHYMDLVEYVVPELSAAYPDLIFGWQVMNEAALYPASDLAIDRFISGNQEIAKQLFELSGKRHHVMLGLRTAYDIYQDVMEPDEFWRLMLTEHITCINSHIYVKPPPLPSDWLTNPNSMFEDWKHHKADSIAADRYKRLKIVDEYATHCDGWPAWHAPRNEVSKHAMEYLQWVQRYYGLMQWALSLTPTYDNGTGDIVGLTRVKSINGAQHEYVSTPGEADATKRHSLDNYHRG